MYAAAKAKSEVWRMMANLDGKMALCQSPVTVATMRRAPP